MEIGFAILLLGLLLLTDRRGLQWLAKTVRRIIQWLGS